MLDAFSFAATETDCEVETTMRKSYDGYRLKRDEPAVVLAAAAFTRCGFEPRYGLSGGGADANVFNERGRHCVNLSHGVFGFHTPDERVAVADLDAMVDVTVALVGLAAE
jgi:tripeptide aminopeptidase